MEASIRTQEQVRDPLHKLIRRLRDEECNLVLTGLKGSSFAYVVARAAAESMHCFLVVTADNDSAEEIIQELRFYGNGDEHSRPRACLFPSWETLPYDTADPPVEEVLARIETLYRLESEGGPVVVVAPLQALLQRCLPVEALHDAVMTLRVGQERERDELLSRLVSLGYRTVPLVEEAGEVGIRGGIVDIFPPGQRFPVRIEFCGDTLDSMRAFDPVTQRSLTSIDEVEIIPVSEVVITESTCRQALRRVEDARREARFPARMISALQEHIEQKTFFPGVSFLLEFFYDQPATIFDYLPQGSVIWFSGVDAWKERIASFLDTAVREREQTLEAGHLCSLGEKLYMSSTEAIERLDGFSSTIRSLSLPVYEGGQEILCFDVAENGDLYRSLVSNKSETRPLAQLVRLFHEWLNDYYAIVVVTHSAIQKKRFLELLEGYSLRVEAPDSISFSSLTPVSEGRVILVLGELQAGFRSSMDRIAVITESEVFGERMAQRKRLKPGDGVALTGLDDLRTGEFVVHVDYGIGRYEGLHSLELGGSRNDFLLIEYRDEDRLYVPVHRLNLVQKYRGIEDEVPSLSKLGGTAWLHTKKKIKDSIKAQAKELLGIYAARQALQGFSFSGRDDYYREFEARFEFDETSDQLNAIEDVLVDMERSRPMDRLVCGDTGYGKTEVALRASFKAVADNKQVALLVPTTVLAHQHYQTFSRRFRDFPIRIGMLSRFQTPSEQKRIIEEAKEGTIDIIVGTHRLLQKDLGFKDLGLVIIDEEHRFGVRHKEKLKKMRELVDVLTLTATPIPRTLQLSMLSIRDLSIISSAPQDRLAVKTYVTHFDEKVIREAIIREFLRDGQVFFVHNRVERIEAMAEMIQKIVPEARLAIAHGQMQEKELEAVMLSFYQREVNLLLCTTIIESGLDFPNANTIIINRADKMGLAQLYQLRGRVGRSSHQAYAYFLVPGEQFLTDKAKKRLEALAEFSELGSGFRLASHDLEIRGGGNILGLSQSGHMNQVGIDLYYELIDKAVKEIKGEKTVPDIDPEIKVPIPAYVPEEYVPDIHQRLRLYKKMAGGMTESQIADVQSELRDRFGPIPCEVECLLLISNLKLVLRELMVVSMEYLNGTIILAFHQEAQQSLDKVLALLQNPQNKMRFTPDHKLHIPFPQGQGWEEMVKKVKSSFAC